MSQKFTVQKNYKQFLLKNQNNATAVVQVPIENLAVTLLKLPHEIFKKTLKSLSYEKLAEAISYIESNKAKHLISRINSVDSQLQKQIYTLLKTEQKHNIKQLLEYPDNEVGAYMHLEILSITLDETVSDVKKKIQEYTSTTHHAPFIQFFIVDKRKHLLTTLEITTLMTHQDDESIEEIIKDMHLQKALMINEHAPISTAVKMFEELNLSTLAVVDKGGKLLGRILFDDVYTFIRVQEEKQALTMLGTHHQAEKSFGSAQRTRLEWIFINLCAILLSALVVNHFKGTIEQIISLAVLMPVVAALGGNVGNQAVTVTVRRLALGNIGYKASSIITKEFFIGIVNGIIVGAVVGLIAYFWFHQAMLGVVVTLAIIINLSLAGLIGSLLPIFFKHFNIDPAIASPLLLTTATDAMGFFVFLGLASVILL